MKIYSTWKTARGANIELITEHITSEEVDLDGHKGTIKADEIHIWKVTVNGKAVDRTMEFINDGRNGLNLTINNKQVWVAIPEDVYEEVWGAHNRRWEAGLNTRISAEKKYAKRIAKVAEAMNADEYIR